MLLSNLIPTFVALFSTATAAFSEGKIDPRRDYTLSVSVFLSTLPTVVVKVLKSFTFPHCDSMIPRSTILPWRSAQLSELHVFR